MRPKRLKVNGPKVNDRAPRSRCIKVDGENFPQKFLPSTLKPRLCDHPLNFRIVYFRDENSLKKANHKSFRDGDPPPHKNTNSGTIRVHEKIISIEMSPMKRSIVYQF